MHAMLQKRLATSRSKEGGFTLIEMLIVVMILAVLATVGLLGFAQYRDNAQASACAAQKTVLDAAVAGYMAGPTNPAALPGGNAATLGAAVTALNTAGYLSSATLTSTFGNHVLTYTPSAGPPVAWTSACV